MIQSEETPLRASGARKALDYDSTPAPDESLAWKILHIATGVLVLLLFFTGIFCAILTVYWLLRWTISPGSFR